MIRDKCNELGALFYDMSEDIIFERKHFSLKQQSFDVSGELGAFDNLKIRLLGSHQIANATIALAVVSVLKKYYDVQINRESIYNGLYNAQWPGRFEIISYDPFIILDGAQNANSASCLRDSILENFSDKQVILVFGVCSDKDIQGMWRQLRPIAKEVIITQADNPRAADAYMVENIIKSHDSRGNKQCVKTSKVADALDIAKQRASSQEIILVTGSLFVVAEAREGYSYV